MPRCPILVTKTYVELVKELCKCREVVAREGRAQQGRRGAHQVACILNQLRVVLGDCLLLHASGWRKMY
jgi:hypothetical protein